MVTDLNLLFTLLGNVLNGLIELSHQGKHRNYYWRVHFENHVRTLREYIELVELADVNVLVTPTDGSGCQPFYLSGVYSDVQEGYTNLDFGVRYTPSGESVSVPMTDYSSVIVSPHFPLGQPKEYERVMH